MKKCAVIELGDHYHVTEQSELLLSKEYSCDHYLLFDGRLPQEYIDAFLGNKIVIRQYKTIIELLYSLFKSSGKYDVIYFQTLLDDGRNRERFWLLIFLILNKVRVVAAIRNGLGYMPKHIKKYWKSYPTFRKNKTLIFLSKIIHFVRVCSNTILLIFIDDFVFESDTQRLYFMNNLRLRNHHKSGTLYAGNAYGKLISGNSENNLNLNFIKKSPRIKFGLLGGITNRRRDYNLLIQGLSLLPNSIISDIEIILLGSSSGENSNLIIEAFKKVCKFKVIAKYVPHKEFLKHGNECIALLSPLKINKPYGTLTGTGAFGDCLTLKRRLILPSYVDPLLEFKELCSYYDNANDLGKLLYSIVEKPELCKINDFNFEKYEARSVFSKLNKLGIF